MGNTNNGEILNFDGDINMKFRKDDYDNFIKELNILSNKYDFGICFNSRDIYIKKLDFYDIVYDEEDIEKVGDIE